MRIHNPKTGEYIENTHCHECMCHEMAMQFGELHHGCCSECGCPKNLEGFLWFKDANQPNQSQIGTEDDAAKRFKLLERQIALGNAE